MSPPAAAKVEPTVETPERRRARLEGIRKLIQQASSPQADGEQAARRVCALIRKFGLDVVDPDLLDGLYKENHELKALLGALEADRPVRRPAATTAVTGGWPPGAAQFWSGRRTVTTPPPVVPPPAQSPMASPVFIAQSKFAGRCKQCRKTINIGDPVHWQKSVGVWCGSSPCYTDWFTGTTQAAHFNPFGTP